jgi:hypothetical protein
MQQSVNALCDLAPRQYHQALGRKLGVTGAMSTERAFSLFHGYTVAFLALQLGLQVGHLLAHASLCGDVCLVWPCVNS